MGMFDNVLLKKYAQQLPGTYAPVAEETIPGTGRIDIDRKGQDQAENYLPRHSAPEGLSDKEDVGFDEEASGRSYDPLRTIVEAFHKRGGVPVGAPWMSDDVLDAVHVYEKSIVEDRLLPEKAWNEAKKYLYEGWENRDDFEWFWIHLINKGFRFPDFSNPMHGKWTIEDYVKTFAQGLVGLIENFPLDLLEPIGKPLTEGIPDELKKANRMFHLTPKQQEFNRKMKRLIGQPLYPMDGPDPTVGNILQSRIHEAFTRVADDFCSLGYMDTDLRIKLSSTIGKALSVLNEFLVDNGLMGMPVDMDVAKEIVFKTAQMMIDDRYTVRQVDGNQWEVTKYYEMDLSAPEDTYNITFYHPDDWRCSCPAWYKTHQPCKHVQMVKEFETWGGNNRVIEELVEGLGPLIGKQAQSMQEQGEVPKIGDKVWFLAGIEQVVISGIVENVSIDPHSRYVGIRGEDGLRYHINMGQVFNHEPQKIVESDEYGEFTKWAQYGMLELILQLCNKGKDLGLDVSTVERFTTVLDQLASEEEAEAIRQYINDKPLSDDEYDNMMKESQSTESDPYRKFDRQHLVRKPEDNRFIIYDIPQVQLEDEQASARIWDQQLGWDVSMDEEGLALIRPGMKLVAFSQKDFFDIYATEVMSNTDPEAQMVFTSLFPSFKSEILTGLRQSIDYYIDTYVDMYSDPSYLKAPHRWLKKNVAMGGELVGQQVAQTLKSDLSLAKKFFRFLDDPMDRIISQYEKLQTSQRFMDFDHILDLIHVDTTFLEMIKFVPGGVFDWLDQNILDIRARAGLKELSQYTSNYVRKLIRDHLVLSGV